MIGPRPPRRILPLLLCSAAILACAPRDDAPVAASTAGVDEHPGPSAPPFVLTLDGEVDPDGIVVLDATIEGRAAWDGPLVVTLELPEGAALERGAMKETLTAPAPGARVARRWRVSSARHPASVVVRQDVAPIAGAMARASFPRAREGGAPGWREIAPVRAGGVTVREAVPVRGGDPKRE